MQQPVSREQCPVWETCPSEKDNEEIKSVGIYRKLNQWMKSKDNLQEIKSIGNKTVSGTIYRKSNKWIKSPKIVDSMVIFRLSISEIKSMGFRDNL